LTRAIADSFSLRIYKPKDISEHPGRIAHWR
jgi:hypothetical protein